ncbi:hypothetical protein Ancab_003683 [Ancistrocladus abbreviatus]
MAASSSQAVSGDIYDTRGPCLRNFRTFSSLHGVAPGIHFDVAPADEQLGDSVDPSEQ